MSKYGLCSVAQMLPLTTQEKLHQTNILRKYHWKSQPSRIHFRLIIADAAAAVVNVTVNSQIEEGVGGI